MLLLIERWLLEGWEIFKICSFNFGTWYCGNTWSFVRIMVRSTWIDIKVFLRFWIVYDIATSILKFLLHHSKWHSVLSFDLTKSWMLCLVFSFLLGLRIAIHVALFGETLMLRIVLSYEIGCVSLADIKVIFIFIFSIFNFLIFLHVLK